MAIRLLEYTVTTDAITNASTQLIGTQGDKNVTKLVFNLDTKLIASLESYSNNGKFYYRFDGYDGAGGLSSTDPIEFDPSTTNSFSYSIENWQTKYGGTIQTFFVITYIENEVTELELYAYSVKMKLKPKPDATFVGGENYESITALAVSTKKYAEEVAMNRAYVSEAEKRVAENLAGYIPLNANLEIVFDGGNSEGVIDGIIVPDSEMSDTSENTVKNKVVKKYIDDVGNRVDELNGRLTDFIVEEGTLGIWNYRKWNSGIAECWGYYEHTFESFNSTAYDLIFYSYIEGIDLPFTFKPIQSAIASVKLQPYVGTIEAQVPTSDESTTISLLFTQFGNSNATEIYKFFIEIKGRWK